MSFKRGNIIDDTFFLGLLLKVIGGALELLGAIVVIFVSPEGFFDLVSPLRHVGFNINQELAGTAREYVFWYLLIHGAVRIGLAYALVKEYLWAYPLALVVLLAFTAYQIYLIGTGHSWGIISLIIFNLIIAGLTYYEYRKLKGGGHLERPSLQ